jgi:hypothetical protein
MENPVETFQQFGGFVQDDRDIDVLYKTRYISDEARIVRDGRVKRLGDVFAYPIYIRERSAK